MGATADRLRTGSSHTAPHAAAGAEVSTDCFFDRDAVRELLGPRVAAMMLRAGGQIRDIARRSIKPKGNARPAPKNKFRIATRGKLKGQLVPTAPYRKWLEEVRDMPASTSPNPPYTHSQADVALPRLIQYALDAAAGTMLVGPSKPACAWLAKTLEKGGTVRGTLVREAHIEPRPYMLPAIKTWVARESKTLIKVLTI